MNGPTLGAAAALFVAVGVAFLVVRPPPEVGRLEAEVGAEPALDRRQRTNVGLVLFVSQALQVLVVTAAIAAFFVAFGALAIGPRIIESWLGVKARVTAEPSASPGVSPPSAASTSRSP